jgi:dihydropteroate synthase/dihydroneopterin aldolase
VRPPIEERFQRPSVMGVVNVTPDSFSGDGLYHRPDVAAAEAFAMLAAGAAIVDVGGESTRPGSEGVPLDEELRRVEPVLERLAGQPLSVDTAKAAVARRALALGAEMVNDVTALRTDPELAGVVADGDAYLCLTHMQGEPRTMQTDPRYDDVVSEVKAFLEERLAFAVSQGIREKLVCLDPGIGFGKTPKHNGAPRRGGGIGVKIELVGLELFGYHGVLAEEKENGQQFWFDLELEVGEWGTNDRIEDAVDYRLVVDTVREVNERRFELLEALASTVAEALINRFALARVKVRVRKRPAGIPVEYSAVTAERP